MDSPENDLPLSVPFRVSSYPTLKFKPAGSREFLDFDGDRSLESLVAFVEQNAKNSLKPKIVVAEPEGQVPLGFTETVHSTQPPVETGPAEHVEL
jgi:protein disulfide-isomerase A1